MASVFDTVTIKKAGGYTLDLDREQRINAILKFYGGDHLQEFDQWVGPLPEPTDPMYGPARLKVQRAFVSQNVIREVTKRLVDAILGRDPNWSMVPVEETEQLDEMQPPTVVDTAAPTEQEQAALAEYETYLKAAEARDAQRAMSKQVDGWLTEWLDNRGAIELMQDTLADAALTKQAVLRFVVPRGLLNDDGTFKKPPKNEREALNVLYLDKPGVDQAAVHKDKNTMQDIGVYLYDEVLDDEGDNTERRAELTYIDDDSGETVIRILSEDPEGVQTGAVKRAGVEANDQVLNEIRFQLDGLLTMFELRVPALITDQVIQAQNQLNKTLTMLGHNIDLSGFLEKFFTNAQVPSKEVVDADGTKRRVADVPVAGPGTERYVMGIPYVDETGKRQVTTPGIVFRDPVSVTYFTDSKREFYIAILSEVKQMHAMLAGEASPSGESRKQALYDFINSLLIYISRVNALGRWLLETALALACAIINQPNKYQEFRFDFNAVLDAGPMSAEERKFILDAIAAGVFSLETGRIMLGISDPAAEGERVDREKDKSAQRQQTIGGALVDAFNAGGQTSEDQDNNAGGE
jgi:hypothetical protein